ncbi:hypothetical protein ACP70R_005522 [Stipagrostis hirtigluma subsp. patula]
MRHLLALNARADAALLSWKVVAADGHQELRALLNRGCQLAIRALREVPPSPQPTSSGCHRHPGGTQQTVQN